MNLNERLAIIITAYQQVELVERNLKRIRYEYPEEICNSPVIIVTTSEISLFDHLVNIYSNTYVINFKNAPGNASQIEHFQSRKNPAGDYLNWRQEFLPPRILISIQNGLEKAIELQCEFAFHLHSVVQL